MSTHHMNNRPPTNGNPGTNGRTLHSPNLVPMPQGGLTILSILTNLNATMIPPPSRPIVPLTAFSSSDRPRKNPHRSSSIQSRVSTSAVPPGHVPINLQDGSKEEWARHVVHALHHPDRMRAANELKPEERPEVTTSMPQDDYDAAKEQLHQVDARIPDDIVEKAIQLFFSTNLLPGL